MEPSVQTLARVLFTTAGGVMIFLGLMSIAYGFIWFDGGMFAMFDGPGCVALGALAVASGTIVLVFARRRVRAV
jgi:hypothetical protein